MYESECRYIDVVLGSSNIVRNARALCGIVPSVCPSAGTHSFIAAVFVSGKERVIILLHKSSSMVNPEKHIKHKNK